jgi:hypothetical protein
MDRKQIVGGIVVGAVLAVGGGLLLMWKETGELQIAINRLETEMNEMKKNPIKGEKGDKGDKGEKGERGDKGDKGDSFSKEEVAKINNELFKNRVSKYGTVIEVSGGMPWGIWGGATYCPDNHYVCGINQKVESSQGDGDDTAVNDLQIYCCKF